MRTVSSFLSRAAVTSISETFPVPAVRQQSASRSEDHGKALESIGERIGEDNEVLRNLLIDTGHQFNALDDLKETLGKLVEPLNKLMGALEHEKSDNAGFRGALAASRASHETLRTEFQILEEKSSELEDGNQRLRRDLVSAQQTAGELEDDKVKLAGELAAVRVALANCERQLGEEASSVRALGDEKQLLLERVSTSDKRLIELESETALSRERLSLLENEKNSLQTALDQTLSEASRTSRRFAEGETVLSDTRARLQQVESSLTALEEERKRLSSAFDEANERRQSEVYGLSLKLDAMRSRSATGEKLLAEVRQNLVARSEEIRIAEAKLVEATVGRNGAQKKAEQLSTVTEAQDRQIKKLEQAHLTLTERYKVLSETIRARESSLAHAQEKIKSLTDRIEQLRSDAAANQAKADRGIGELNAAIERERVERTVAQGALETTRESYDQIQRQISTERAMRRRSAGDGDKVGASPPSTGTDTATTLNGTREALDRTSPNP
jgi:chromosome segregation ATPase